MYVTIFGGSKNITNSKEYIETIEIGKFLAEKGYTIQSGGYYGVMEAVSIGATSVTDGKALGYTCQSFPSSKGNKYLTGTIVCKDIFDRLRELTGNTNLFVIQKGSVGTLTELFLVMDKLRREKPEDGRIILIGSFWVEMMNSLSPLFGDESSFFENIVTIVDGVEDFKNLFS